MVANTAFLCPEITDYSANISTKTQSPSNIALVKYWGKYAHQIPANPSLSFTLKNCHTTTKLNAFLKENPSDDFDFEVFFEGGVSKNFRPKITAFFERVLPYMPFLKKYRFEIHTENSFPHSSGIASSASGMAALSLCLMQMQYQLLGLQTDTHFYEKASFLSRLGSGSACRSIKGGAVVWGANQSFSNSSDLYGVDVSEYVHPVFKTYQDSVLLIEKGAKKVSSTTGHHLMNAHPFAKQRFAQAHENLNTLKTVLKTGDVEKFISIVEGEALTLHAMMMTSHPYFILMKPATLSVIEKIWDLRHTENIPVCFTLDAGANVHLLYPDAYKNTVQQFIKESLAAFCENGHFINDHIGEGSVF